MFFFTKDMKRGIHAPFHPQSLMSLIEKKKKIPFKIINLAS